VPGPRSVVHNFQSCFSTFSWRVFLSAESKKALSVCHLGTCGVGWSALFLDPEFELSNVPLGTQAPGRFLKSYILQEIDLLTGRYELTSKSCVPWVARMLSQ